PPWRPAARGATSPASGGCAARTSPRSRRQPTARAGAPDWSHGQEGGTTDPEPVAGVGLPRGAGAGLPLLVRQRADVPGVDPHRAGPAGGRGRPRRRRPVDPRVGSARPRAGAGRPGAGRRGRGVAAVGAGRAGDAVPPSAPVVRLRGLPHAGAGGRRAAARRPRGGSAGVTVDEGLSDERTALAWQRTSLSLVAGAAVVARLGWPDVGPSAAV